MEICPNESDTVNIFQHSMIRYDTEEEFNVDSKAEWCSTSSKKENEKKLKQTNTSAHLIQVRLKIREGSPE